MVTPKSEVSTFILYGSNHSTGLRPSYLKTISRMLITLRPADKARRSFLRLSRDLTHLDLLFQIDIGKTR